MNDTLERFAVQVVEEYYHNNTEPFFNYIDEHFIWIGPATHQYIEGKQALLDAFAQEHNTLSFRTAQMSSKLISGGNSACELLLKFIVYTYYPSGYVTMHNQRITMFWKKLKVDESSQWKCAVMHISNGMEIDDRDHIYPLHLDEFEAKQVYAHFNNLTRQRQERLIAKSEDYSTYYIEYTDIEYICAGKAKFCDIHTKNGIIRVRLIIEQLRHLLPQYFYRPHRSYLVNILEISVLSRNQMTLKDGTKIPIPVKKATQVEADIAELLKELKHA